MIRTSLALVLVTAAGIAGPAAAQDPAFGHWLSESGKAIVEIGRCGGEACGQIVWLSEPLDAAGAPKTDIRNEDAAERQRFAG